MYVYGFFSWFSLHKWTSSGCPWQYAHLYRLYYYMCNFVLVFFFLITHMFVRFKFVNNFIFFFRNNRLGVEAVEIKYVIKM